SQLISSSKNYRHATVKILFRWRRGHKPFERRRSPRILRPRRFSARQTPEKIQEENELCANRCDCRNANNSTQTVDSNHRSRRETSLKQSNPVHGHEQNIYSAKRQPKMNLP